jgi:DNA processing protein
VDVVAPDSFFDLIALNLLPGLGPISVRRALARFGDAGEVAFRISLDEIRRIARIPGKHVDEFVEVRRTLRRRTERELRLAERRGIQLVPFTAPDYPAALLELPDAPVVLYQRGELPEAVLRIGVVGSRSPTSYGRSVACGLASHLAARGVDVVSGGARGIDTAAHEAAVTEEGRTVAVLGSGLLRPYPFENEGLFERIASSGALLSEFPLEQPPKSENFPRRNRLISGLSAGVIVVEAADRSGSLITAGLALEQGREVMAVPGRVDSRKSEGCNRLIQQGAKLVQNVTDILDELSPLYLPAVGRDPAEETSSAAPNLSGLTTDESDVIGILAGTEPVQLDRLAEMVPFGIARLQTALFGLEVRGAVEQSPGRYYVLRPQEEP